MTGNSVVFGAHFQGQAGADRPATSSPLLEKVHQRRRGVMAEADAVH